MVDSLPEPDENISLDDDYVNVDASLICHKPEEDGDNEILEEVCSKRPQLESTDEEQSSEEDEVYIQKPSDIINWLHETERFLLHHGKSEVCNNLLPVINAVRELRDKSLVQKDIRLYISRI